ncbi:adenylyl cyclase [Nakamurella endophytica]|uniref:Coagulation factor 5/8 type n=1 Tax=Nakamurella endophytica TaxID=1748367 RepID=A0A917T8B4_9ACTN|nr:adenylyl cyclase [Nakamurella endophytica]GGM12850.1 coagulation factor 5/8 type [Nakamurella endophytica]
MSLRSPVVPSRRTVARAGGALVALVVAVATLVAPGTAAAAAPPPTAAPTATPAVAPAVPTTAAEPALGRGVYVFDPSMPQAVIQQTVDAVAAAQTDAQFGEGRVALLFRPGTYGSPDHPLSFSVGYYTEVAGLGSVPSDVTINGTVNVYNRCLAPDNCIALDNFWRSLSNLTIAVAGGEGCRTATEFWAVSQAAPMRRVQVRGNTSLMDYCTAGPQYASGGFIADSAFTGPVTNGSQQQFLVRNSALTGWSNGVWNQVFAGTTGAPATSFGQPGAQPYTTLAATPVSAERPFLATDAHRQWVVHVPAVRRDSAGPGWTSASGADRVLSLCRFLVATPATPVRVMNHALATGRNLLLTPGVYRLTAPITVTRRDTVVLGLGFPTLVPTRGTAAVSVHAATGLRLAGVIVDAGPVRSRVLVDVGGGRGRAADPAVLSDVFLRVGGAAAGRVDTALQVSASHVVLDDIWSWRADHGTGVGWTVNTAATGLRVTGDDVTAYGLFVEHYQRTEVVWSGQRGTVVMFQNELPYDPPSQAAWQQGPGRLGYPAFALAPTVRTFQGWGMGSYSNFDQGVDIHASTAFVVPRTPGVQLRSLLTVFLDGSGGIDSVVDGIGAPVTSAQQGVPSTVVAFP